MLALGSEVFEGDTTEQGAMLMSTFASSQPGASGYQDISNGVSSSPAWKILP